MLGCPALRSALIVAILDASSFVHVAIIRTCADHRPQDVALVPANAVGAVAVGSGVASGSVHRVTIFPARPIADVAMLRSGAFQERHGAAFLHAGVVANAAVTGRSALHWVHYLARFSAFHRASRPAAGDVAVGSGVASLLFVQILASLHAISVVQVAVRSCGAFLGIQVLACLEAHPECILHHIRVVPVVIALIIAMGCRRALRLCKGVAVLNARGGVLVAMRSGSAFVGVHAVTAFDASCAHCGTRTVVHSRYSTLSQTSDVQMRVTMLRGRAARFREAAAVLNTAQAVQVAMSCGITLRFGLRIATLFTIIVVHRTMRKRTAS
jgi:hypothetical protein